MITPSSKHIDMLREAGLRPEVVGCIVYNRTVFLPYTKKHKLWFFPQGGIDNKEDPKRSLFREMSEELGIDFAKNLYNPELFWLDKIIFSGDAIGTRDLKTDLGKPVLMRGKYFLFYTLLSKTSEIDINKTEFDHHIWADYKKIMIAEKFNRTHGITSNKNRQLLYCANALKGKFID
jgi:8-oxo-dGTP pyrophosphatase MutT (NUDIX family)